MEQDHDEAVEKTPEEKELEEMQRTYLRVSDVLCKMQLPFVLLAPTSSGGVFMQSDMHADSVTLLLARAFLTQGNMSLSGRSDTVIGGGVSRA